MKYLFLCLIAVVAFATSCDNLSKNAAANKNFGEKVDTTKVIPIAEMLTKMEGNTKVEATTAGKVTDVCKSEGCWMMVDESNGKQLYVSTEEKFFLPKDITGKEVVFTGYAYNDTTSVKQLQQQAKENGKTEEDINKIITPQVDVAFIATGVLIK